MQFIDLKSQYQNLKENIDKRIQTVLDHGRYILGPEVSEFERQLADYVGVKHVVSCANGTDALQLCMMLLDIKQGDVVFCPTYTFFASAEIIAYAGATPVFVDSDPATFNICPLDLEKKIQQVIEQGELQPKAIIAVDLFGLPADYAKITPIAEKYGLKLIEDAAQGIGGQINGKKAGSFAELATTSFFPAKPLGCYGDGGAIFTDNDEYAHKLRSLRMHGQGIDKYHNVAIGINSRLDTIQAAVLLEKLAVFDQEIQQRNALAEAYNEALSQFDDIITPKVPEGYLSCWAQYTVVTPRRDKLLEKLSEAGVPTAVYYDVCMHQQPVFSALGYDKNAMPVANSWTGNVFSLPMHPYMVSEDFERIIDVFRKA